MGEILWKPLYYISLIAFVISAFLFPFDQRLAMVGILFIISMWSLIPGIIHYMFNTLSLQDFFAFIVSISISPDLGAWFFVVIMLLKKVVGPDTWSPYILRICISGFVSNKMIPFVQTFTNYMPYVFLGYMATGYLIYYGLVVLFYKDEIGIELAILPSIVFFDFAMNYIMIIFFGQTLELMLTQGILSGAIFAVFTGAFLGYFWLSRNAEHLGRLLRGQKPPPPSAPKPPEHPRFDYYHYMNTGKKVYHMEARPQKGKKKGSRGFSLARLVDRLSGQRRSQ